MQPLIHQPPHDEQRQDGQQDQDGRQQVAQAEDMLFLLLFLGGLRARGGLLQGPGKLRGILLAAQCPEQLGHGLDALGRPELQAHPEHIRNILRHRPFQRAGAGVGVRHQPLCRRNRALPADHPVDHGGKAVFVGVAALKFGGGILLRCRVALVQLLVQAAARCAQTYGSVTRQACPAVFQHPDVLRADAAVHQPHLMHGRHTVKHRLQHIASRLGRNRAGTLIQPLLQRDAAGVFHHGVDGVVLLEHVQHGLQTVCRRDALDGAVEIGKVHPGGLEQHLAAQLGPEQRVRAPLRRQRQGHILLDGHPEPPDVLHAPVQDALAVDALHLAHGIPPGQQRAHRQAARRVAPGQYPAAVRAHRHPALQLAHAVRADAFCFHMRHLVSSWSVSNHCTIFTPAAQSAKQKSAAL